MFTSLSSANGGGQMVVELANAAMLVDQKKACMNVLSRLVLLP